MMSRFLLACSFVVLFCGAGLLNMFWWNYVGAFDATSTNFFIRQHLVPFAGSVQDKAFGTSTTFMLVGTGGQAALGTSSSASFEVRSGYLRGLYDGPAPEYVQGHYHWRNDDGSEAAATSKTSGTQDTPLSSLAKLTPVRLRIGISNESGSLLDYTPQQFRLEYGVKSTTCADIVSWVDVGAVAGDWDIAASSNITEGNNTTNIAISTGGVTDENHTFISSNGALKDTSSTVSALSVSSEYFVELEYSIEALSAATDSGEYCFRVTHAGSATRYVYSVYPQVTIEGGSLTFITDGTTQAFGTITPGILAATSSILRVTTGNATGFSITVNRNDIVGTLSNGSVYIPDKTSWVPGVATTTVGNATASTTEVYTLQFRVRLADTDTANYSSAWWGTADTTAAALFAGLPTTAQTIINRSTSAGSGTVSRVLYNLTTPSYQQEGLYSGNVTYTAVANP